ncbi:MAG: DUF362 domain-containing protein [Chitinivibrionales bacterium]|nr:DUF362 domain-containing protein [Chitinivibrionales bacterium]
MKRYFNKSRRSFITSMAAVISAAIFNSCSKQEKKMKGKKSNPPKPSATVFRAVNGNPVQNMGKILSMMGGIENIVGHDDIVVIKPNLQWWNQGAPNIAAVHCFVTQIFNRPGGFSGEVVIAENSHMGKAPWEHAGWNRRFERNSGLEGVFNYNELAKLLRKDYGDAFSACYLINVKTGAKRVYSPSEGPGYVYCDGTGGVPLLKIDNGLDGDQKRETIMTYPVMKTDRETTIDFKNGIWEKDAYSERPLRFFNFAALNHHSFYCGVTSAVKNYLGIVDLSGGPNTFDDGKIIDNYYNFHTFPFDYWDKGPVPGVMGSAIGYFMKTVRKADMNFITAQWSGLASRVEPPVSKTKIIMASKDPVALDYHASKYVLHPNSNAKVHDPDNTSLPLYNYLAKCAEQTGYIIDEKVTAVKSFDFLKDALQDINNLEVKGDKIWGNHLKSIAEHVLLHFITSR